MAKEKQKICSHCEGRISVEADTCLYCGMPLVVESANASSAIASSLYSPPYKAKAEQEPVAKFSTVSKEESSLGCYSSADGGRRRKIRFIWIHSSFFSFDWIYFIYSWINARAVQRKWNAET
jgi:hypothetical protein